MLFPSGRGVGHRDVDLRQWQLVLPTHSARDIRNRVLPKSEGPEHHPEDGDQGLTHATSLLRLASQRIRADLELHDLALGTLAAFDVPHEVCAVVGVQRTALPPSVRIIDASVQTAAVEAQRIRNAERGPLLRRRIQRQQRVAVGTGGDRDVLPQADDALLDRKSTRLNSSH